MDFSEIYHFLFETVPGIAVLVGVGLVASILVCAVLELKTRRRFRHRDEGASSATTMTRMGRVPRARRRAASGLRAIRALRRPSSQQLARG